MGLSVSLIASLVPSAVRLAESIFRRKSDEKRGPEKKKFVMELFEDTWELLSLSGKIPDSMRAQKDLIMLIVSMVVDKTVAGMKS